MPHAIVLRNVTKRFGAVAAVENLSLTVPAGSIYGFIGPNGSGKTTTLRMIMHILLPDEGQIELLGSPTLPRRASRSATSPKNAVCTRR